MSLIPEKSRTDSLFYKWFLNNQATMALVITLLAFLTIFVFTKISFFIYASDFFFCGHHVALGYFDHSVLSDQTLS